MLNKTQLLARSFVSKNDSRPVLEGILITPDKVVATNTYILAEIKTIKGTGAKTEDFPTIPNSPEPIEIEDAFIMSAKVADKISKSIPKSAVLPILENAAYLGKDDAGAITLVTTDLDTATPITFKPIDGKFPEYESVIPTDEPTAKVRISASFLLEAAKLLKKFNKLEGLSELDEVYFEVRDEKTPVVLTAKSAKHEVKVLIMPIKN